MLSRTRALTLCGPGGIGKTRLALRPAGHLAAAEFPDGVWFVELADLRQPDLVVSRIAAVIGITEEAGRPLLETLGDALRPRRLLLALDNCEHLLDACAQVGRHLLASAPGLRLLDTSREPLSVAAETIWRVPPLSVAPAGRRQPGAGGHGGAEAARAERYEAVRLFADRAAASRPGFAVGPDNVAAVTSICRALDGMPLAIELAAARVRALSVEQIIARLDDRFGLLTTGDRSAAPRQRTLRAAIEWSYELLTGPERALFRRLAVFTGWSLEMAEQVCADEDIPAAEVLGLTAALVDKSLVVLDPELLGQARYRMLDTIREYAALRLAQAGESAAFRGRLRDYALRTAEHNLALGMARIAAPWPARVDVFRRYDVDAGNVTQVLNWCLEQGDAEAGLRICAAVSPCWIVWGTFGEGGEWLRSFLALDMTAVPARIQGAATVVRGQLALSSDPAAAWSLATEGLKLCREADDRYWIAAGLNLLAEIALHTGRIDEAEASADEALAIAQASGDGWNEGYALGTRAAIAGRRGKLREAEQLATASVAVMRRIDQQWGAARAMLGLGDLARFRNHPGEAHGWYVEALAILREIGARPEIARCLAGLGRVAMDLGAFEQARRHLTRSLRLSHATGARIGVARGLEAFAALTGHEGRPELAVQLAAAAAALRETAGLPPLSGARVEAYLAPARRLGDAAVARLWASGLALTSEAAVALALDAPVGPAPSVARPEGGPARREPGAGRGAPLPGGFGAAELADPAGVRDRRAGGRRPVQQGHRGRALHQPHHRGQARGQHHGQAGLQLAYPDRRVDGGPGPGTRAGEQPGRARVVCRGTRPVRSGPNSFDGGSRDKSCCTRLLPDNFLLGSRGREKKSFDGCIRCAERAL